MTGEAVGWLRRFGAPTWTVVLGLAVMFAWKTGAAAAPQPTRAPAAEAARKTPSGLLVPRYVTLKFGEVNARAGPGDDYRLLWTYRTRGLPLQVIAETQDWRRVCDPEGQVAWVHQRTVDNLHRTVMRMAAEPVAMRRHPDPKAGPVAMLEGRSLATLGTCRGDWCEVSAGRAKGWVPGTEVWGIADSPQCRPTLAKASP